MKHRMLGWLSHRQHEIEITGWAVWVVGGLAAAFVDGRHNGPTSWAALFLYAPVAALAWFATHRHARQLCDRCIAEWPLDGPTLVTAPPPGTPGYSPRRARAVRWRLRALHLHHHRMWPLGAFIVVLVASEYAARWWWPAIAVFGGAAALPVIAGHVASRIHQPLEMWCPWCPRDPGDGGNDERAPEPDPAGKVSA